MNWVLTPFYGHNIIFTKGDLWRLFLELWSSHYKFTAIFGRPTSLAIAVFHYRLFGAYHTEEQTCSNQVLSNESSPESRPASEECCTHHNFIELFNFSINKRDHFRSSHELRLKIMWRPNKANDSRMKVRF